MHHKYGLLVVKDAYLWVCTAMYCEPLAGLLLVTAKLEQGEAAKRAVVSWKPTVEWFWMVVVVAALFYYIYKQSKLKSYRLIYHRLKKMLESQFLILEK